MISFIFDDKARVGQWVSAQIDNGIGSWGDFYAMGVEKDGELVAGVVINEYNGSNAACHIAVTKPGKYLVQFFRYVADYAFNHCKLKRLTGAVPSNNQRALAFDKHLGFEEEFVMKKAARDGHDLHILVIWPENCRWLQPRGE
jgi:RimJ/RimL family protein N-acetyltransferase